jgi:hypothetical protein
MIRLSRSLYVLVLFALAVSVASAQVPTGTPPFGSFAGGPDVIDLANLNSHITVPVLHKAGRGMDFSYDLSYDSSVWYPVAGSWHSTTNWGWRGITEVATGYISVFAESLSCTTASNQTLPFTGYTNFAYHDAFGTVHKFNTLTVYAGPGVPRCFNGPGSGTDSANDGSGFSITARAATSSVSASVTSRSGQVFQAPVESGAGSGTVTDRNGNIMSVGSTGVFTDTLNTTALTVTGVAPTSTTFSYTPPSGPSASYTMSYHTYTVKTNFGCSGIADYGPTSNSLVDRITLPDGTFYQFNYEATPGFSGDVTGRLASVTLPTGGTISYTYTGGSGGHITCTDGSASGLTRVTPDGAWTYARTAGTGAAYTTTVTDPQSNQTQIQFQGLYETLRQVYQGAVSPANLLRSWNTCYNSSTSPCTSTAVALPILRRTVIDQYGSSGLQCKHDYFYNTFGLSTEQDDYDYGTGAPGPLLKKTAVTYASIGNIQAFPLTPPSATELEPPSSVKTSPTTCRQTTIRHVSPGWPNTTTPHSAAASPPAETLPLSPPTPTPRCRPAASPKTLPMIRSGIFAPRS